MNVSAKLRNKIEKHKRFGIFLTAEPLVFFNYLQYSLSYASLLPTASCNLFLLWSYGLPNEGCQRTAHQRANDEYP